MSYLRRFVSLLCLLGAMTLTGTASSGCSPTEPCPSFGDECDISTMCCGGSCTAVAPDRSVCK